MPFYQGFRNTPFSKCLIFMSIFLSCLNASIGIQKDTQLDMISILQGKGFWNILTYPFSYSDPGQMVFGTVIFYKFRSLERLLGSTKYGVLAALSIIFGVPVIMALSLYFTALKIASGPVMPLFSSLILYYVHVPVKSPKLVGICGLNFSEKSITYLLIFQLFMSNGIKISAVVGIIFGCIYAADVLTMQSYRPPLFLVRFFTFITPLFRASAYQGRPLTIQFGRSAAALNRLPTQSNFQDVEQAPLLRDVASQAPLEEHVATLEAMGFDRSAAISALHRNNSNVERAAHNLLEEENVADTEPSHRVVDQTRQHTD